MFAQLSVRSQSRPFFDIDIQMKEWGQKRYTNSVHCAQKEKKETSCSIISVVQIENHEWTVGTQTLIVSWGCLNFTVTPIMNFARLHSTSWTHSKPPPNRPFPKASPRVTMTRIIWAPIWPRYHLKTWNNATVLARQFTPISIWRLRSATIAIDWPNNSLTMWRWKRIWLQEWRNWSKRLDLSFFCVFNRINVFVISTLIIVRRCMCELQCVQFVCVLVV